MPTDEAAASRRVNFQQNSPSNHVQNDNHCLMVKGKTLKWILPAMAALILSSMIAVISSGTATAGEGHFVPVRGGGHVGIYLGIPFPGYWSYPAPYPYYPYYPYYPPVVSAPSSPPVYIEQGQQESASSPQHYWYYCKNPEGYYPYVRACPAGWQAVAPQPSDQPAK
jgi:hypothetical protein